MYTISMYSGITSGRVLNGELCVYMNVDNLVFETYIVLCAHRHFLSFP